MIDEVLVVDTDVASDLVLGRRSADVHRLAGRDLAVTFVTVGELWRWAEARSWGGRPRDQIVDWLDRIAVIDSDGEVSRVWGSLTAYAVRRGRPRPTNDSWIAACCLALGLPLATRNVKDFQDFAEYEGLELIPV